MRTTIPYNRVSHDYERVLREFIAMLAEKQQQNLKCVYLSGSYARGDACDASDLDLFCIFGRLDSAVLADVGHCARHLCIPYDELEINTQAMTEAEYQSVPFGSWGAGESALRELDSVLLYGTLPQGGNSAKLSEIYKKYMSDVVMSIRHYLSVDEPQEKLTHRKIKTYILKPLLFALRIERYLATGAYPLTVDELRTSYNDERGILIEYFTDPALLERDIAADHRAVLNRMQELVLKMIFH